MLSSEEALEADLIDFPETRKRVAQMHQKYGQNQTFIQKNCIIAMGKLLYIFPNATLKLGDTATLPVLVWCALQGFRNTGKPIRARKNLA